MIATSGRVEPTAPSPTPCAKGTKRHLSLPNWLRAGSDLDACGISTYYYFPLLQEVRALALGDERAQCCPD